MEVRIKFSADIYIEGKTMEEIREKFESISLWSAEAQECSAECSELLLVEDAHTYDDLRNEYDTAYDKCDESDYWQHPDIQHTYEASISFFIANDEYDVINRKDKFLDALDEIDEIDYTDVYDDGEDWCIDCIANLTLTPQGDVSDQIYNIINNILPDNAPCWDFHYIKGIDNDYEWQP